MEEMNQSRVHCIYIYGNITMKLPVQWTYTDKNDSLRGTKEEICRKPVWEIIKTVITDSIKYNSKWKKNKVDHSSTFL
jgi:hypothetical protein